MIDNDMISNSGRSAQNVNFARRETAKFIAPIDVPKQTLENHYSSALMQSEEIKDSNTLAIQTSTKQTDYSAPFEKETISDYKTTSDKSSKYTK